MSVLVLDQKVDRLDLVEVGDAGEGVECSLVVALLFELLQGLVTDT
jgi:hypothetical protein